MSLQAAGALASPLYDSLREWLELVMPAGVIPPPDMFNALCDPMPLSGGGVPVRFVAAAASPARTYVEQYEVRTFLRGEVAVREASAHDMFNALAWMAFPHTKAAINKRHFDELESQRQGRSSTEGETFSPGGKRSATRDALTLFDESGIIVASACADLLQLIRNHDWKRLFWECRADVIQEMRFFVIGHALHEKALQAYKGMTGRALLLPVSASFLEWSAVRQREWVDKGAAAHVETRVRSTRDFAPLPIMGIPGWADNGNSGFYDDAQVFR